MSDSLATPALTPRIWSVGALCRAVADALNARFNPIAVQGEIGGFTRAASGHCYFTLKDEQGQLRCAMFKRVAQMQNFFPREGDQVEVFGRLGVYEPRGELQLIVESMRSVGQGGALFEQFLRLKEKLQAQGWFDTQRKRPIKPQPKAIGVVTSLSAAAWHDVMTALQRRVPHIPVILAPALVQGAQAPLELVRALQSLSEQPHIEVVLLVRGGGSLEDLWAFNDERLAQAIVNSRVPVISGVGHETDFTIADFCADLRAPTPTAAAELCAAPQQALLTQLSLARERLQHSVFQRLDQQVQRLDRVQSRLGRPSQGLAQEKLRLMRWHQQFQTLVQQRIQQSQQQLQAYEHRFSTELTNRPQQARERLHRAQLRLHLLDPRLVLERGYAWLNDEAGQTVSRLDQIETGQSLQATLVDGRVDLEVKNKRYI